MALRGFLFVLLAVVLSLVTGNEADQTCKDWPPFGCNKTASFNRDSFKPGFVFGAASSAYQIEGAEGRGTNIWDGFTHRYPEKEADRSNGDIATYAYKYYEKDVESLSYMGLDAYRFSIAWSRIIPRGKRSRGVNEDGIEYYNNLINSLILKGITPFVTLFHWDLPQTLQDEYEGFLDPQIVDDLRDYADLCFERFGDRVKNWITLNQPYTLPTRAYGIGTDAPGRCSAWLGKNCYAGDSATEPYIVAHHELLAHAAVVDLYRKQYQPVQRGKIGITTITRWFLPYDNSEASVNATWRAKEFFIGWFLDPVFKGDYPSIMKEMVGDRLPKFSPTESKLLKGSCDFVGVNYYVTQYAKETPPAPPTRLSVSTDPQATYLYVNSKGDPVGPPMYGLYYRPRGILDVLEYIRDKYGNPTVYITENGYKSKGDLPLDEILGDYERTEFICSHLCYLRSAIQKGCKVEGFFVWSLTDNFEFCDGFTVRFGFNYVNFKNLTDRRIKDSGKWFKNFLHRRGKVTLRDGDSKSFQEDMMISIM